MWWSIAMEKNGWKPKQMWCPHCGHEQLDVEKPKTSPISYEMFQQ
jgi:hypothetical protein|tara:strand:+ start:1148 stop:1282 length:135 start_codon:yes stop_codon:yes gene_type:complete